MPCYALLSVAGNFHFAPGKSFQHQHMHVHDLAAYQQQVFNVSHRIHALSFGESFPGQVNPLDAVTKTHPAQDPAAAHHNIAESGGMFMYTLSLAHTHTHSLTRTHTLALTSKLCADGAGTTSRSCPRRTVT